MRTLCGRSVVGALLLLTACSGSVDAPDSGPNIDSGTTDSGVRDSGVIDSGVPDAGPIDAGAPDAGPIDSGTPDAGAPDAGPADSGIPKSCTALLCEDFERFDAGTRWTFDQGYNAATRVTIQQGTVAHGQYAMQAHVDISGNGFARLVEHETFPALANGLWGRASFYATVPASSGHTDFITVSNATQGLEIGYGNGTWQLTYYPGSGEAPQGSTVIVPTGRWVCLEWHFQRAANPLIEVFLDGGTVAVDSYAFGTQSVQPFTQLKFGFGNHSANATTTEAFYDDVAIDSQRIGCP